ncbi:MAG: triosephosphate isomerase [Phycisphaerales bacterium]|nr:MAG: triosephosphate isomerase [Phycisphaerales bacterium]
MPRTCFIGGNWKMNTSRGQALELAADVARAARHSRCQVAIYPPFVWLETIRSSIGATGLLLGAQDCSPDPNGPHTGQISLEMLRECGVQTVLVGHSERRHGLGEPDALIARKLHAVLGAGMIAVLCIGETLEQRQAGQTDAINRAQLLSALASPDSPADGSGEDPQASGSIDPARLVVAYEPVWAIGTGRSASSQDAQAAHAAIRAVLAERLGEPAASAIRIIYGGSMTPANAPELLAQPDVDGGLVGGASLKADQFLAIVEAAG